MLEAAQSSYVRESLEGDGGGPKHPRKGTRSSASPPLQAVNPESFAHPEPCQDDGDQDGCEDTVEDRCWNLGKLTQQGLPEFPLHAEAIRLAGPTYEVDAQHERGW